MSNSNKCCSKKKNSGKVNIYSKVNIFNNIIITGESFMNILCTPFRMYFSFLKFFYGKILSIALLRALILFYCFTDSNTPIGTKLLLLFALGYFFSPLDCIPDIIPFVGMGDDVGIMAFAKTAANKYISLHHKNHAYETLKQSFGEKFAKKSNLLSL